MGTLARANEIVAVLTGAGLRATLEPALAEPPCILVIPPNVTYDLACGLSAKWQLVALAPAARSPDRTSWGLLDDLLNGARTVLDIRTADLASYVLNGQQFPSYLLTWDEAIND